MIKTKNGLLSIMTSDHSTSIIYQNRRGIQLRILNHSISLVERWFLSRFYGLFVQ